MKKSNYFYFIWNSSLNEQFAKYINEKFEVL